MEESVDVSDDFFTDVADSAQEDGAKSAFQESFSPKQIGAITKYIEPVSGNMSLEYLIDTFKNDSELGAVPVEQDDRVVGIITRQTVEEATSTGWKRFTLKSIIEYTDIISEVLDANNYIEKALGKVSKINRKTGTVYFPVFNRKVFYGIVSLYDFLDKIDEIREQDLEKAKIIQQNFMPASGVSLGSCEFHAWNRMANSLGGDIYQAIHLNDTTNMICCFDVSGKNVAAALLTIAVGSFFKMIKLLPDEYKTPKKIIGMLDSFLQSTMPVGNFITAAICCIDEEAHKVVLYNCGHTSIYIIIRGESGKGKMAVLDPTFPPMGMGSVKEQLDNPPKDSKGGPLILPATDGMHISLYSDGFTDMKNDNAERYEDERAKNFFIKLYGIKSHDVEKTVEGEVDTWIQNAMLPDDITVLDLRIKR